MPKFSQRLKVAKERAGLTYVELAIWFDDMSGQTVWSWTTGREPKPYHRARAEKMLGFLEKELKRKQPRLPMPLALGQRSGERHSYVANIRKCYK